MNNVRCNAGRHCRNKDRIMNLKLGVRTISEASTRASLTLKSVNSLELIQYRTRRVMWLLTPPVYWLGGETISLTYRIWMGLMMLGRLVSETNGFEVEMTKSNLIIVQQDATYSVYYISVRSSTCFGCWHPSSWAGTAVITAPGID